MQEHLDELDTEINAQNARILRLTILGKPYFDIKKMLHHALAQLLARLYHSVGR